MKRTGIVGIFVLVLILVVAVAGGAYYLSRVSIKLQPAKTQQPAQITPSPDPTANWRTYQAESLYKISYPDDTYGITKGNQYGDRPWKILEPGVVAINPKLSKDPSVVTYIIEIGVTENTKNVDLGDPKSLFGNGPVAFYPAGYVQNFEIKEILLDGTKAYRVDKEDGLEILGYSSDILTIKNSRIYEILVQSSQPQGDPKANKQIVEQILSTFKFIDQTQASQMSSICTTEKNEIVSVVTNFENLQKARDPKGVLNLFTSPELKQEIDDYKNLSGTDVNTGPRLYNNVSTSFNTLAYKILSDPAKYSDDSCSVTVEEQRSYYGGPANPQYLPAASIGFTFIMIEQNRTWKIDKYQNQTGKNSGESDKYGGWF